MDKHVYNMFKAMADNIAKNKRQVIYVKGDKEHLSFSYTVGHQERGLPELLLISQMKATDHEVLLNLLGDVLLQKRKAFVSGQKVSFDGTTELTIINTNLVARVQYTCKATEFYNNADYKVQQVLVPDPKGRLPDDPLCHKNFKGPVLREVSLDFGEAS